MKSSIFFAAVLLAAVSIMLSCVSDKSRDRVDVVSQEQLAGQFLNYVAAFNELWSAGTPADGDAAGRVSLPGWLSQNSSIRLYVSGGAGYAFMPATPGLYAQLLQETENSAHFGLSDDAGINTPSGQLVRPGFIPAGYVVYVR